MGAGDIQRGYEKRESQAVVQAPNHESRITHIEDSLVYWYIL